MLVYGRELWSIQNAVYENVNECIHFFGQAIGTVWHLPRLPSRLSTKGSHIRLRFEFKVQAAHARHTRIAHCHPWLCRLKKSTMLLVSLDLYHSSDRELRSD